MKNYFLSKPVVFGLLSTLLTVVSLAANTAAAKYYDVQLHADLNPKTSGARVVLTINQPRPNLKELNFSAPADLFSDFKATAGKLKREGGRVIWTVPEKGGELSWHATLNVPKGSGYDARITKDWALMRFEDIFPPLRSTAIKGSTSNFFVVLDGPKGWSFETRYGRFKDEPLEIESSNHNFDRPTGWLIAGELGVRREQIAGRAVTIAAPTGTYFPRVPTLAFLRWTLPELERVFPVLPDRLLVVSGNDEMWRGALSGPESLFVHSDRPLISENGTSTLLHELVHVATRLSAAKGDDWIVEGLAEYYSLEVLRRSDGLSGERFSDALASLGDWVKDDKGRLKDPSKGADTAAAALLFHDIAQELRERKTRKKKAVDPLDSALHDLLSNRSGNTRVSRQQLQDSIEKTSGAPSKVLAKAMKAAP